LCVKGRRLYCIPLWSQNSLNEPRVGKLFDSCKVPSRGRLSPSAYFCFYFVSRRILTSLFTDDTDSLPPPDGTSDLQKPGAVSTVPNKFRGDWVLFHPVYTQEELASVRVRFSPILKANCSCSYARARSCTKTPRIGGIELPSASLDSRGLYLTLHPVISILKGLLTPTRVWRS
jgi:hypothetical protein